MVIEKHSFVFILNYALKALEAFKALQPYIRTTVVFNSFAITVNSFAIIIYIKIMVT